MPDQSQKPDKDTKLPRIRTFQSDVEEVLKTDKVSLSTIALSEAEKKRSEPPPPPPKPASKMLTFSRALPSDAPSHSHMRTLLAIGIAVLVLGTIGAGSWWFSSKEPPTITELPPLAQKLASEVLLEGTEGRAGTLKALRAGIDRAAVQVGEVRAITVKTELGALTTEELFAKLEARTPLSLLRALDDAFTLGVHGLQGVQPFLLFKVDSFDHAFDAMLAFEKTMLDDLGPLFGVNPRQAAGNANASTTEEFLANPAGFKDLIVRNKDVRAFFDTDDNILFLYSFLDDETLLITTKDETLKSLISKTSRGRLR